MSAEQLEGALRRGERMDRMLVEAEGLPVTAPFVGKFVRVEGGYPYPDNYRIRLVRGGGILAPARTLASANLAAAGFERDEAAKDAERLSRRVARFFRLNFIFN